MGTFGTGLYEDDITCDVRDSYISFLRDGLSNAEAYAKIMIEYNEYFGDDEEPLFWYALAETQWKTGRLNQEVKQKALDWIEKNGGLELWEDDEDGYFGWKKTLEKLKSKLEKPMPPEKKIRKPVEFVRNPWNINDVYAYQFHGKKAEERGLIGKYILIQKIANEEYCDGWILSRIHVFDRVYDKLPCLDDIEGVRLLPLVDPFVKGIKKTTTVGDYMNAKMLYYKKSDYPSKYLTFIGNKVGPTNKVHFRWFCPSWAEMDDWLSEFYIEWQGVDYATISDGIYGPIE